MTKHLLFVCCGFRRRNLHFFPRYVLYVVSLVNTKNFRNFAHFSSNLIWFSIQCAQHHRHCLFCNQSPFNYAQTSGKLKTSYQCYEKLNVEKTVPFHSYNRVGVLNADIRSSNTPKYFQERFNNHEMSLHGRCRRSRAPFKMLHFWGTYQFQISLIRLNLLPSSWWLIILASWDIIKLLINR